jgi:hypothetical protein
LLSAVLLVEESKVAAGYTKRDAPSPRLLGERIDASQAGWEQFPHDADVGLRGWGATLAEAFEQAALALTGVVTDADVQPLSCVERHAPVCEPKGATYTELRVAKEQNGRWSAACVVDV